MEIITKSFTKSLGNNEFAHLLGSLGYEVKGGIALHLLGDPVALIQFKPNEQNCLQKAFIDELKEIQSHFSWGCLTQEEFQGLTDKERLAWGLYRDIIGLLTIKKK
jgi:hypothetical protein